MTPRSRLLKETILSFWLLGLLLVACSPAPAPTDTRQPAPARTDTRPPASPTPTELLPTLTVSPTPTLRPEMNVALRKPVRVSSSWVVDPPERAVNGNPNDWWGAGGPPPNWIEVDLGGYFSISKIKVINEGPRGRAVYRVLGRGPGNEYRLLYIFDGIKTGNQTLEALPGTSMSEETAWEDISTVRVEILNGTGWSGFREVQVFSRQDPKPLPVSAEDKAPLFLAQVKSAELAPITPENAILMEPLAMLGRGPINHLAWSPDGEILAAASPLGVWLYDPASPQTPPRLLGGHTRDVLSVAFSSDGKLLYSASQDGSVKQWDPLTGDLKRTAAYRQDFSDEVAGQDQTPDIWAMAISPDAKLLATGADDGSLQLWGLSTGLRKAVLEGHRGYINKLVFSPDGKLLASSDLSGGLLVWDAESGDQLAALPIQGQVQSLVFSPDSRTLAYGGAGMAVRLWDAVTGEDAAELVEHTGILSLSYSPDGLTLASSSLTGAIQFWDAVLGGSRVFSERAGWIMKMAYSPDGESLATVSWDGALLLWKTTSGTTTDLAAHTSPVTSLAFSPDGTLLASGGEDNTVRLWEVESNSLRTTLWGHQSRVSSVAFSPDGERLVSGGFDNRVILWDILSGRQEKIFEGHDSFVRCLAFSPDGKLVASGSTDKTVRLWDAATGEETAVLSGHTGEIQGVAFSPDGAWLVSASTDFTLRFWDVATGKESGILKDHTSFALSVAFSPDGTGLASTSGDHSLRAWDLVFTPEGVAGTSRFPPIGHPGWVMSVAFSPDGKIIASANISTTSYWVTPGEIHLYASGSGFPYNLLRGHTKRVTRVAFSPDGKLLASGSADGSVRLWGIRLDPSLPATGQVTWPSTPTPSLTPGPAVAPSPTPSEWDPFVGEWAAVDLRDGSNETLTITREGDSYSIVLLDDKASLCGLDAESKPQFGAEIRFTGTVRATVLNTVSTSVICLTTPEKTMENVFWVDFTYQSGTDTLRDSIDFTNWKRK